MSKKTIKVTQVEKKFPVSKHNINDETPIILFSRFNGDSIKIHGFNNCYRNSESSIKSVYSFINKIKIIQQKTIDELFNGSFKRQSHCHPITNQKEVERINNVLLNGYKFNETTIENLEGNYYEFSLDNGERVIFVRIDNILELLFIDNNHMIYKESSKLLKYKESFEYPSCFGKINFSNDYKELSTKDTVKMMIESYKNGEFDNLDDFVENLEDLIGEVKELEAISS